MLARLDFACSPVVVETVASPDYLLTQDESVRDLEAVSVIVPSLETSGEFAASPYAVSSRVMASTPEPGSLFLLGTGLLGLMGMGKSTRRK